LGRGFQLNRSRLLLNLLEIREIIEITCTACFLPVFGASREIDTAFLMLKAEEKENVP
jgi:hypothetical protein